MVWSLRRRKGNCRIVQDEGTYYLVRFPSDMSHGMCGYGESFVGDIIDALSHKDLPIVLDFSGVRQFDTPGLGVLCSISANYPSRSISAFGVDKEVIRALELNRLDQAWNARVGSYSSLEDVLVSIKDQICYCSVRY